MDFSGAGTRLPVRMVYIYIMAYNVICFKWYLVASGHFRTILRQLWRLCVSGTW